MGTRRVSFQELISAENVNPDNSKPYPFCLAYPLEKELEELGEPGEWLAEYKWDGIRGQIIRRNDEVFIWSRGEELITEQFPEITETVSDEWQLCHRWRNTCRKRG
jgi:DNA ligase-1